MGEKTDEKGNPVMLGPRLCVSAKKKKQCPKNPEKGWKTLRRATVPHTTEGMGDLSCLPSCPSSGGVYKKTGHGYLCQQQTAPAYGVNWPSVAQDSEKPITSQVEGDLAQHQQASGYCHLLPTVVGSAK